MYTHTYTVPTVYYVAVVLPWQMSHSTQYLRGTDKAGSRYYGDFNVYYSVPLLEAPN